MAKEALVIDTDTLFRDHHFEGFLPLEEHDFITPILENYTYKTRGDELEHDASLQQIIPYLWLINKDKKKVFAYTRIPGKEYVEKRLMQKFSCGLGGHIDREDSKNPIMNALNRELREEIIMNNYPEPNLIGYVNLEYDVHEVHFGIVAVADTIETEIESADGVKEGSWYTVSEIEQAFADPTKDVEEWTKVTWPFVKKILEN